MVPRHSVLVVLALYFLFGFITRIDAQQCSAPACGSTIDTLNGVVAYSNACSGDIGCYDKQYKWECVEFVQRYYLQRLGLTLGSIPTAAQAFSILRVNPEYEAHPQHDPSMPQAEDIIVFGADANVPDGHVAIAHDNPILQSDGTYVIPIIEQNSYLTHKLVMKGGGVGGFVITGRVGLTNTAPIMGWIRRNPAAVAAGVTFFTDRASWLAATVSTTTITFNGVVPAGSAEIITTSSGLTTSGVTFVGVQNPPVVLAPLPYHLFVYGSGTGGQLSLDGSGFIAGPLGLYAYPEDGSAATAGDLVVVLPGGVTAIGVNYKATTTSPQGWDPFGGLGVVLSPSEVFRFPPANTFPIVDTVLFAGLTAKAPISTITFRANSPSFEYNWVSYDNFTLGAAK